MSSLPQRLTVAENLRVYGHLYNVPHLERRIAELAAELDLGDLLDRPAGKLSAGQKTRVALAKALINRPELLLLDEPTASLDPDTGDWVRTWLERYRDESGCTILLASHNMAEVERLCSHVLMLKQGRIVDRGSPQDLLDRYGREDMEEVFLDIARDRRRAGGVRHEAARARRPPHLGADVPPPGAVSPLLAAAAGARLLAGAADVHLGLHRELPRQPHGQPAAIAGATLLGGVLLWEVALRSQMGVAISFMEEMWSRNLGHVFVSPLRPWELVAALILHVGHPHAGGRAAGDRWSPGCSTPSTCSRWARCWCCSSST